MSVTAVHAQETQSDAGRNIPVLRGVVPGSQDLTSAQLLSKDVSPVYPEILRRTGVQGELRAQFVVDTTGKADMAAFKILTAQIDLGPLKEHRPMNANSNEAYDLDEQVAKFAFTESVRQALVAMQFKPASADGKLVKQLVDMPFNFDLHR